MQTTSAPALTEKTLRVYVAIKDAGHRSRVEDSLVLDGFDVRVFPSAATLWDAFQARPPRIVITERRFGQGLGGLDLVRNIRRDFLLPYVFVVMLSAMNQLSEIKEGLAVGVDDYLVKPPNPFQLRSRVLVATRWLQYIDSLNTAKPANG